MAFHHSSRDIDINGNTLLATCTNCAGDDVWSSLNLDVHLGNDDGTFDWHGINFSQSAKDVSIGIRGDTIWLAGQLRKCDGSWKDAETDITHRIANIDGVLKYADSNREGSQRQSRGFLSEERDFLSTAISETISDLKDLFIGASLFDSPFDSSPRRRPGNSTSRDVPSSETSSSPREEVSASGHRINLEDSTSSVDTSIIVEKESSELKKEAPPAYEEPETLELNSEQREAQEHEDMVFQQIKDFLLGGTDRTVTATRTESGGRKFVLQETHSETSQGSSRTLTIADRTLFDQDDYSTVSELSDLGHHQARCLTPSVVDGEDEYDFLNY